MSNRARLAALTLWLALGTLATPAESGDDRPARFADPNLEAVVRKAAGKPTGELNRSDLAAVSALEVPAADIVDLTGLEALVGLVRLNLDRNPVRDLQPIAQLPALAELSLNDTFVTDTGPIAKCVGLKSLSLEGMEISDLSFLAGLKGLSRLSLSRTRIVDLGPLAGHTALKYLALEQNQITSIAPLRRNAEAGGLGRGDEVRLANNPLTSVALHTDIPFLEGKGAVVRR